jgi:hypothetical protein
MERANLHRSWHKHTGAKRLLDGFKNRSRITRRSIYVLLFPIEHKPWAAEQIRPTETFSEKILCMPPLMMDKPSPRCRYLLFSLFGQSERYLGVASTSSLPIVRTAFDGDCHWLVTRQTPAASIWPLPHGGPGTTFGRCYDTSKHDCCRSPSVCIRSGIATIAPFVHSKGASFCLFKTEPVTIFFNRACDI